MNDNTTQIEALLHKYWEGNTTLQEEMKLQAYFNNGVVAEHLKSYQSLFQYFQVEQKQGLAEATFENLLNKAMTQTVDSPPPILRSVYRQRWFNSAKIAATIALIVSISFWLLPEFQSKPNSPCGDLSPSECQEALKALEETKTVLLFVSNKLNHGAKKAAGSLDKLKLAK